MTVCEAGSFETCGPAVVRFAGMTAVGNLLAYCAACAERYGVVVLPTPALDLPAVVRVGASFARRLRANGVELARVEKGRFAGFHCARHAPCALWELLQRFDAETRVQPRPTVSALMSDEGRYDVARAAPVAAVLWHKALQRADRDPLWVNAVSGAYALGGAEAAALLLPHVDPAVHEKTAGR